jgi:hypothetical protein
MGAKMATEEIWRINARVEREHPAEREIRIAEQEFLLGCAIARGKTPAEVFDQLAALEALEVPR